jgi:hypothetical protein
MNGVDQQQVPLSARELATILCALRSMQDRFDAFPSRQCHAPKSAECVHFDDQEPLSADALDELCDRVVDSLSGCNVPNLVLPISKRSRGRLNRREPSVRSLTITDSDWMNGGEDDDHLTMILVINGTFHHLEAIRIVEDDDGRQHAASPDFEDIIDGMFLIGGDGPFDTLAIRGGTYVIVVIPFQ